MNWSMVAPASWPLSRGQRVLIDRRLRDEGVAVGLELWTQVVDVGDESPAQLVDQVQQGMAIEVDPDQAAGDAALVAGVGAGIGRAHGVDGRLLTGYGVGDGLDFGEGEVADLAADIGAGEREGFGGPTSGK